MAQLEKEKEETKELIRDLENLKRKDPKAYQEGLEWGDARDDLEYLKKMLKDIENNIKKTKINPGYGKEISRRMNVSNSGLGMALGGTIGGIGGGLLARKMTKKFSTAGREWAGFKGGMKGALKGAKWGAILAPGNLIAAGLGHPKTALGITAAGSVIGGGIGFKLGRDSGISEYKYKNDPEYKEKVDKDKEKYYLEDLKSSQKSDEFEAWDFNIKDWKDFSDSLGLPPEILKYIKFYESWRKNIKLWYSKALPGKDCDYWAAEFRSFFPIPIPAKIVKEWYETDKKYHSITFLTDNDAGDDGYVCYDLETKLYGWDRPNDTPSLKTLLQDHTKRMKEIHELSREQENLVNKFLRSI